VKAALKHVGEIEPRAQFHQHIRTAFTPVAPKIQSSCQCLFKLLGSTGAKATRRALMKLTLGLNLKFNGSLQNTFTAIHQLKTVAAEVKIITWKMQKQKHVSGIPAYGISFTRCFAIVLCLPICTMFKRSPKQSSNFCNSLNSSLYA